MIRALILGGERLMRVMVLVKAKAGIMPSTGEGLHPSGECRLCLIPRQPKSRREREPAHDASGVHPRGTDGSNPALYSGESGANSSRREHYATLDQVGSRHLGKRPRDVANTTFPEAFPPINVSGPRPAEEEGCEISVPLTVVMPPRFRSSSWPNGSISTGPPARRSLRLRRAIAR